MPASGGESPVEAVVGLAQREIALDEEPEAVLAEEEASREFPAVAQAPVRTTAVRSRLSTMPFAVLLPPLGALGRLAGYRPLLEARLDEIGGFVESAAHARAMRDEARMIEQALEWLDDVGGKASDARGKENTPYDPELCAIYELGRLYFETGFLAEAEVIFLGLRAASAEFAPSFVGIGLVRLEKGEFQESLLSFREAVKQHRLIVEAKIGMGAAFLALGENRRAATILLELSREVNEPHVSSEVRQLWQALSRRSG
jgi:hypothetical protein